MKTITFFVLSFVLLNFQEGFGQQTQSHWLVGSWEGKIEEYSGKDDPGRTLQVDAVSPDGKALARWTVTGQKRGRVDAKVEGSQVQVVTGGNSLVELTREGDDSLSGTFTLGTGRAFPIKLARIKPSTEFDGDWTGMTSRAMKGCGAPYYNLTVKNSQITGRLLIMAQSNNPPAESAITGIVNADGTATIQLTGARKTKFTGKFSGTEFKGLDPAYGGGRLSACSYEVELKRK